MAWRTRPRKLLSRDSFFLDTDKALEVADKGPVSAVYADVLRMRIRQRRKKGLAVPRDAYENERGNELYFALLKEIEDAVGVIQNFQEDESKCTLKYSELQGDLEQQLGQPLWYVVDALVDRNAGEEKQELQEGHEHRADHLLSPKGTDDADIPWAIFWEHYRGDGAKTTSKEVAVQRSCNRKPLLPSSPTDSMGQLGKPIGRRTTVSPEHRTKALVRQLTRGTRMRNADTAARHLREMMRKHRSPGGAPSMSLKIMQEMAVFEEHERRRISGEEERLCQLAQRIAMEEREEEEDSSDADNEGGEADVGMEEGKKQFRKLVSRNLSRSNTFRNRNRLQERRKAVKDHGDTAVHAATLPFVEPNHMPPVFCFQGFDDYKRWQNMDAPCSARERGKREIVKVAARSPQVRWSSAVREHEAAAHWRRTRKASGEIDGGPLVHGSEEGIDENILPVVAPQTPRMTSPRPLQPSLSRAKSSQERSIQNSSSATTPRPPPPKTPPPDFHRPWSRGGNRHDDEHEHGADRVIVDMKELKCLEPLERFAKICRHTGVHPQPCTIRFLATLPPKMNVRAVGFADEDLLSLVAALPYKGGVEAVDAGENPRLTDASICTLLRTLADRHSDTLSILHLDHCPRLGRETIALCTNLLENSLSEVQIMDISGIQVPLQEFSSLSFAIRRHMKLKDVRLAETGLGMFDRAQGSNVIANLVAVPQLEHLDIGWNSLDAMAFQTLGKGLVQHEHLKSLGMSNTGAKVDSELGGSPVLVFLEFLEKDNSLTYLDVSNNSFDEHATITLECASCRHPKLQHVDLSQNQLGPSARRSMIRLLANLDCPQLVKFTANECRRGIGDAPCKDPFVTDPTGTWNLNMAQPPQRAVLKLLLMRFSEGPQALPPSKLIKNAKISREEGVVASFNADSLKRKGEKQVWDVPTSGVLNLDFCAGDYLLKDLDEKKCPSDVVQSIMEKTRLKLTGRRKTLAVLSLCKAEQDEDDRATWLEALSQDFMLTPEQVKALCHSQSLRASCAKDPGGTCCRLLPCLMGPAHVRQAVLCTHNLGELLRVHTHGHHLLSLHVDNPTGHYNFHLSEPPDRNTAEKLLLLNRWEISMWLASGRIDISQHQNQKNVRNETYDNTEFVWNAEEWGIFGSKSLSFDYVSLRRPPQTAKPISDEVWQSIIDTIQLTITDSLEGMIEEMEKEEEEEEEEIVKTKAKGKKPQKKKLKRLSDLDDDYRDQLKELGRQRCGWERSVATSLSASDVIWALRACSSRVWVRCKHVRKLLCLFTRRQARAEALTCMVLRTLDWPCNAKLLRGKFSSHSWRDLERRLGSIVMFPFFQPENTNFQYDLRLNEQRRCLSFLTQLAAAEHHKNIKHPRIDWRGPHPTPEWDTFMAGIPITWTNYDSISSKGLFECTYTCSMDLVSMRTRRQLAAKIGGWSNLPEGKIDLNNWCTWWSILDEVPREVVMVLEFMNTHFKSLSHVFEAIDANKDRSVTYREFMNGMKKKMRDFGFGTADAKEEGKKKPKKKEDADDNADKKETPVDGAEGDDKHEEKRQTSRRGARVEVERTGIDDERLTEILTITFKFLDPNNDAELSPREFEVLEGIWRELQLTLWEFVQHMTDCFGSLENAWKITDKDHNESVDYEEFETLSRFWQFDGPVRQIFMYLDRDGNGTIGLIEWIALSNCEKPKWW